MLKSSKEICEEIMNLLKVCDYDNARTLIENFLKVEENNVEILDLYAEVLVNLELPDQAKIVLEKSIQIAPNSNGDKYMSLAELSEYKLALKLYLKGIEVYNQSINQKNENEKEFKISIANGYAAIAELYMNSPLCNEKNAEKNVEKYLMTALEFDEKNVEVLLQFSNLRILRCRDSEAIQFMDRIYESINYCVVNDLENYPSLEAILQLAKNYLELEGFPKAIMLLDILIKFDDENLEYWYLLAFCHFKIKNYKNSLKCLKNLFKMKFKLKDNDTEIEEAAKELSNELNKIGELTNNILLEEDAQTEKKEERCEDEDNSSTEIVDMNID